MNINKKYLDTTKYLRHVTDINPNELGKYLIPHYNHNAYGELPDDYVFAAGYGPLSKALYFLKSKGLYLLTKDETSSLGIIKTYDNFLASFQTTKYMYFIPIDYFYKSVSKEGIFVGEYVSKDKVPIIEDAILTMNINMALYDDELGKVPHIYICENMDYYKKLREKLDLISNYDDKIKYLEGLNYIYDNITGKIKVLK